MFDFSAYTPAGHRTIVVEAKRRLRSSPAWATEYRRNLLSSGRLPDAELFLLVTPDRLFVWKSSTASEQPPDFEIDAGQVLAPYFDRIGVAPDQIEPMAFEMIVSWWLNDLAREESALTSSELSETGVLSAIAGAEIRGEGA